MTTRAREKVASKGAVRSATVVHSLHCIVSSYYLSLGTWTRLLGYLECWNGIFESVIRDLSLQLSSTAFFLTKVFH